MFLGFAVVSLKNSIFFSVYSNKTSNTYLHTKESTQGIEDNFFLSK